MKTNVVFNYICYMFFRMRAKVKWIHRFTIQTPSATQLKLTTSS